MSRSPRLLLPACVLALAACGSPDAGPPAAPDPAEQARRYVECLRENGIDVPDADPSSGAVRLPERTAPGVRDALRACGRYAPRAADDSGDEATRMAAMREYASCMRDNGVPDFPDPDPDKGPVFPKRTAELPGFADADRECRHLAGDTGKGGK